MGSFWGDITAAKNRCARVVVKARVAPQTLTRRRSACV
jgi:hypothetical protein